MSKIIKVTGGAPVQGTVTIAGSKNAASKAIIASLLTDQPITLHNIPLQQESVLARELVSHLGAITQLSNHTLTLQTATISNFSVESLSQKNRLAILTLAPLLHRVGKAQIGFLGGDKIGARPINFHLEALQKMGAVVRSTEFGHELIAPSGLTGQLIELPYPSVGTTETVILAAVLAKGRTVIKNSAVEPEIVDLIMLLQKMGAIIEQGAGRELQIIGVDRLGGCEHTILPDRIEVASFASLAMATRGEIFCQGAVHRDLVTFLNAIRRLGGRYQVQPDGILFQGGTEYRGLQIETDTHPGFMTDWQQPLVIALTQAVGTSVVHETVYEERFGYINALTAMGADITPFERCLGELPCRFKDRNYKHSIIVRGPTPLKAANLTVPDIRAGLAYLIATLVAEGESTLTDIDHLERGYEDLYNRLIGLGAKLSLNASDSA